MKATGKSNYSLSRSLLMGRIVPMISGIALAAAFALGAHKSRQDEGPAARLAKAPASARALINPFAGNRQAAAAGRKLYQRHCAECHGPTGHGIGHAADLHSAEIQGASAGALFWAIRNGRLRKGMPAWSGLPDPQLWQLVTFLQTLNNQQHR